MSRGVPMIETDPVWVERWWDPDAPAEGDPRVHSRRSHKVMAWRHRTDTGEWHRWTAEAYSVTGAWERGRLACGVCHPRRRGAVRGTARSLAIARPDLAAEWHPTRNDHAAADVSVGSGRGGLAWWLCSSCRFEFPARVDARTRAVQPTGCPRCAGQAALPGDPATLAVADPDRFSELACRSRKLPKDLDPLTLTIRSNRIVPWRCRHCRRVWTASPNARRAGVTCPHCASAGTSRIERDLADAIRGFEATAVQGERLPIPWNSGAPCRPLRDSMIPDIAVPDRFIAIEYDGVFRHSRPEGKRCDLAKTAALLGAGWRVVRVREQSRRESLPRLDLTHPRLAQIDHLYGDPIGQLARRVIDAIPPLTAILIGAA